MKHTYILTGMTCGGCLASVEKYLSEIKQITHVAIDLEKGEAELDTLKRLKQVLTSYNNLTIEERGQLAININGMMINPFSYLLR